MANGFVREVLQHLPMEFRGAEADLDLAGRFAWMSAEDLDAPKLARRGMLLFEVENRHVEIAGSRPSR